MCWSQRSGDQPRFSTTHRKRLVNGLPPQAWMSGLNGSRERLPVMRKQFLDPVNRMRRDAREHITEPGERLNGIALAHRDEAQQHGRRLAAPVAAKERPVPATNGDVPIRPLGGTIVDLQIAVFEKAR